MSGRGWRIVQRARTGCLAALIALPAALAPAPALGQGVLTLEVVTGHNLVVDSNVTAPSTYAPRSSYLGSRVCNTGDAPLADVFAFAGDRAGATPGVFPATTFGPDAQRPHLAGTGSYSLTLEAGETGVADGTRHIGTLAAGECRMEYWLVSYPRCVNDAAGAPQEPPCTASIAGDVKPDDDLSLSYDVWATTGSAIAQPAAGVTRSFTLRNEISAAANKIWPNTASKVPDAYLAAIQSVIGWGTLGPDGQPLTPTSTIYPGQRVITTQGIWYDLGNVGAGFDNNGDLVPDQNAWLQPVGDPASFDADCFRMVNVYGVVIVKLKTGGELLIPFENRLYFENLPDNTGVVGLVYYQFIATDAGCSASMTPYQEAASGFDNEKFSADYGLALGLASSGYGASLTFTKSDGASAVAPGGISTYTLTAGNATGVHLGAPDLGTPLAFSESIPAGTTYQPGTADDGLSPPSGSGSYMQDFTDAEGNIDSCAISYAVSSSAYTILYSTDGGSTWVTADPGGAVTDIRWLLATTLATSGGHNGTDCDPSLAGTLQTSLPAGKSAAVSFRVLVNSAAPFPGPVLCNTAGLGFGAARPAVTARDCNLVTGANTLGGTVFRDDGGTGGIFGNGAQDNATETGIGAGVVVQLFFDANGDGALDAGDLLYGGTATAVNGNYAFASLPDGPFLVVVKKYDGAAPDGADNAATDAAFGTAGWGDTTYDPNLPLAADQGVLKLGEDLTTVALAVNVDFNRDSGPQTVSNVNFGFAPPLRLTKAVAGNPDANADGRADAAVDEGDLVRYPLTLENRLPSVGRQGPTGCEYTVWAAGGATGASSGNKNFANAANVWDATSPNSTVGSAYIQGGGNRWVYGTGLPLAPQAGGITRVEALYFGYFDVPLTDDFLNLTLGRATVSFGPDGIGGANTAAATIGTALIDNYIGAPATLDPSAAISWDITSLRPNPLGSAWQWADFPGLYLQINPTKTANSDYKTFFLDAVGLRVTTDRDCEAGASTTLGPVPLRDTYDTTSFAFVSADPAPASVDTAAGLILWDDVGPILPGAARTVTVTLRALNVAGSRTGSCPPNLPLGANSACNWAETAYGGMNVKYADGRLANDDSSRIAVAIQGKAELHGVAWRDANGDGWPDNDGEPRLPNVPVTLWACLTPAGALVTDSGNNRYCTTYGSWQRLSTTVTDGSGAWEFIGLDRGYYIVEVGNTDGAPVTGNSSPYGGVQRAEPNDTQAYGGAGGNATGTAGVCAGAGGCNNTWGNPGAELLANQSAINLLADAAAGSEERVNGIDFGYGIASAAIHGKVWHDVDGDAAAEAGEAGLAGFTVRLYSDADGDGVVEAGDAVVAATSSDALGTYVFSGLAAGGYVVVVTPPQLPGSSWVETVESSGGASSLDNRIPVTVAAGVLSGPHDFGYTLAHTSDIGDTLWYDFDADGVQDLAELGLAGVTVRLFADVDRDGRIDDGVDVPLATDVTDGSGRYLFADLAAGSYVVQVDTADPDFPGGVTATGDPDLNAASIGDRVWLDADADGVQDGGEEGIPGVVLLLTRDADGDGIPGAGEPVVAATVTNAAGGYLFTGLNAGGYFVDVDEATLPSPLLTLTTADPAGVLVTLADRSIAAQVLSADAGYSLAAGHAIGSRVWSDADGDNVQDPGEVGIPGVTVTVTSGTGAGCSPACSAVTGVDGYWLVTGAAGLGDGTFAVDVSDADLPRDFTLTAGTDPRTVTVAGADLPGVDFGYRYDTDGDVASEDAGDPTGAIAGRVYNDVNGNEVWDAGVDAALGGTIVNLLDAGGAITATAATLADGTYAFTGVFVGTYSAQAVDEPGALTSVLFLSAGQLFPDLDVVYDPAVVTAADSRVGVSVDGAHDDLNQDFGYQRFRGSLGDTVYQDVNGNATQDAGEPGIAGVGVALFLCGWSDDGDGLFESGEESGCASPVATTATAGNDPLTPADEGGKYLFSNLDTPAAGLYYVARVDAATLPGVATLVADPDTDGAPCTLLPDPDVDGDEYPPPSVCDGAHLVPSFVAGINYLGADFGYRVTGPGYGIVGDHLWLDADGDGTLDDGEPGIPHITVWLDANGDRDLDWTDANGNGVWDGGEGERWVETAADGYYVFTGLADGVHDNLRVLNGVADGDPEPELDPDWPAGLPPTPVYEARGSNTGSLDNSVGVAIAGGTVTVLDDGFAGNDPDACAGCDLAADFGYRHPGANSLAGTICIESGTLDGYCGDSATTYTGVGSGESPLAGIVVTLYLWNDDGDGVAWTPGGGLGAGDAFTLLGSTSTDAAGDYAFANVPDGKLVVVASVSDTQNLRLTTTSGNSGLEPVPPALSATSLQLHEGTNLYLGRTVSVFSRQAIDIVGDTRDVDYAFDASLGGAIANDFGDLPDTFVAGPPGLPDTPDYASTLLASNGARHALDAVRLGATVSAENDGRDAPLADLDADDGVLLLTTDWVAGAAGAAVEVSAPAGGWLAGWIDFNGDGDFTDAGEEIASLAVGAGATVVAFDVPAGVDGTGLIFFARFRIYPERPLMVSSTGAALDALFRPTGGEVEDFRWNVNVTPAVVTVFTGCDAGGAVALEWRTASGRGSLGFILRRWDEGRRAFVDAAGRLLPALIGAPQGVYRFLDAAASPARPQAYELLEIEAMGRSTLHGPFVVDAASTGACAADPPAGYTRAPARAPQAVAAPAPAALAEGGSASPGGGIAVKIATTEEAVHFVSAAALARALGVSGAEARRGLRANLHTLSNRGRRVAFLPAEDGGGVWFFAQRQLSQFARENVYRLDGGGAVPLRMEVRDEDAAGRRIGEKTFPRLVREERDLIPVHGIFTDARRDHWLWDYLVAGEPPKAYTVRADAVAHGAGEAAISLLLLGATDTDADTDHHALVRLNGTLIGEARWNGLATQQATFTFDAALLADGENTLEIAAGDDTTAPYGIFYLDSFALRYRSRYRASGDRLAFAAAGNRAIRVTGFSTPEILLFDVTRPRRPVLVTATPFEDGEGGWGVAIAPRSPDARYQALTRAAAAAPARVGSDLASDLRNRLNRGRYLVVTTRELLRPAARLAAHRGGVVVDLEDVYDEFNHGVPSPFALRRFLSHAWRLWRTRPRYVVLAGDGTFDYRDNLGAGGNLIPPMLVGTGHGLFPSDVWFADVAGGAAPEMAIGRLPVSSAAEFDRLVDKIILREGTPDRAWTARLLALADDADKAGDFPADSDRIAALAPPGVAVGRIHLGTLSLAAAREALFSGIREGAGLINYVGHAGYEVLAEEGLLGNADVPLLENDGRPTVLTAMTCLAGDFAFPGYPGIAEALVRRETGGAAAAWAPTGLSVNDLAVRLAEGFHAAAFAGGGDVRVGDAVLAAQRAFESSRGAATMLRIYVLLGDPALRLR